MERDNADEPLKIRPWRRLWVKLAIFGALGVVVTHSVHLFVSGRTTSAALTRRLEKQGQTMARVVAEQGADAVLTEDRVTLQELVDTVSSSSDVAYCFIHRNGTVLATSFRDGTPSGLVQLKHGEQPMVIRRGDAKYLDVHRKILGGRSGAVHVGLQLNVLKPVRQQLAVTLGLIALLVVAGGVLAAFVVGRRIARPVGEMVAALQHLDPSREPAELPQRSGDEIGKLTRMVNKMRSRLYRAHVAQELESKRQMQTEKLAALGTLLAGVAHEVNNPLAGLKNCQRRLCKADLPAERKEEYLSLMDEGLVRIERLVRQLLRFSRGGSIKRTPARMPGLIGSASRLVEPALRGGRVRLEIDTSASSKQRILVDEGQVEQALVNLLLNAAFVTPYEGVIRVRTRLRAAMVGIEISDQGPGIPAEIRHRVEDPFFSTKPEGKGTGLGLSVTRSIVDAHHGDLTFAFPEEGGTTITLWFPRDPSA